MSSPIVCRTCKGVPPQEYDHSAEQYVVVPCPDCTATPGFETCRWCGEFAAVTDTTRHGPLCAADAAALLQEVA